MFGVNEAAEQFPKVKPAAVRVGLLKGAVVKIKAVYINAHSGSVHSGRFLPGRLIRLALYKKNARHTARRG
jgi:hypothetical protein